MITNITRRKERCGVCEKVSYSNISRIENIITFRAQYVLLLVDVYFGKLSYLFIKLQLRKESLNAIQ